MSHNQRPSTIAISDYTYNLPNERIAKYPLQQRDQSKLLVFKNKQLCEDVFRNVADYIPDESLMIFNQSKVIPARIFMESASGKHHEVFCLEPMDGNYLSGEWLCLARGLGKNYKRQLTAQSDDVALFGEVVDKVDGEYQIRFTWTPKQLNFLEVLETIGNIPIPPYLKRDTEALDLDRYQTTYAKNKGSVAAPTAGLHFTSETFKQLKQKNVALSYITLHVGAGTFKPVQSETLAGHKMHEEWLQVKNAVIEQIISKSESDQLIIAVGTTSLRTIESLYWMGVKLLQNYEVDTIAQIEVKQWDVYDLPQDIDLPTALSALKDWLNKHQLSEVFCKTQLLITPTYQLRVADALATNFHQPNSTLLLLVASIMKDDWRMIYDYALDHDFRFLSYGDTSLLFR